MVELVVNVPVTFIAVAVGAFCTRLRVVRIVGDKADMVMSEKSHGQENFVRGCKATT